MLFLSGDGGWNAGVVDMARRIAAAEAIVIGVSYPALTRTAVRESGCWYVASDLEIVSHAAQKALKLAEYHPPVLAGYSSGATAVYAALANPTNLQSILQSCHPAILQYLDEFSERSDLVLCGVQIEFQSEICNLRSHRH